MSSGADEAQAVTHSVEVSTSSSSPSYTIVGALQTNDHRYIYKKPTRTSRYALLFTVFNCCIGSGLLAIPKVVSVSGFVVSACYNVTSLSFCFYCFMLICEVNYHGNFLNARELARNLYGKVFMWSVDISILACILPITYVTISADYIRTSLITLANLSMLDSTLWTVVFKVIVAAAVIFPLTIFRSINALNIVSSFTVVFVILAFVMLNVRFFGWLSTGTVNGVPHAAPPVPWYPESIEYMPDVLSYYTIFSTLYSLHASLTPIQFDIAGSPRYRARSIKMTSLIILPIVTVIYIVAAVEGSLMFNRSCGDAATDCLPLASNILLSFTGDTMISVVMLLYSIVILTSFPVMLYPIRANILSWFKIDKNTRRGQCYFILVGLILTIICATLAILIPNIDKVLSIMGNVFGIIVFQLFPVFTVYKLPLLTKNSVGDMLEDKIKRALHEKATGVAHSSIDGVEFGQETAQGDDGALGGEEASEADAGGDKMKGKKKDKSKGKKKVKTDTVILKKDEIAISYKSIDLSRVHYKPKMCVRILFYTTSTVLVLFNASAACCEIVLLFRKHN